MGKRRSPMLSDARVGAQSLWRQPAAPAVRAAPCCTMHSAAPSPLWTLQAMLSARVRSSCAFLPLYLPYV